MTRTSIQSFRDLEVWQTAMTLVSEVYALARSLPTHERYELGSQIRRAVVSVPANISEGHGRSHTKEYLHHLSIAYGSLSELETLLLLCVQLDYLPKDEVDPRIQRMNQIGRMINGLQRSLERHLRSTPRPPTPDP